MDQTLRLDPQGHYIELVLNGEISYLEAVGLRQAVNTLCRQHHIHKLLVDARDTQAALSAVDLYALASELAGRDALPGMHYALVIGRDSSQLDLFEQIARRRGARFDHFTRYQEAVCELQADEGA